MGVWDAVIVDEAHNARRGSNFYALLEQLRDYTHAYYLLTATPMQLHSGELYDLMQLLDLPGGWDNRDSFMEFFETRDGLSQALNEVLDNPSSESDEAEASWDTQATLDGLEHQDRLPTDRPSSSKVFQHLADELETNEDRQDRAIAKERVLTACRLARAYGDAYDGYLDHVDDAMADYDIDRFEASEDTKLKRLLYPEDADEWLMASRSDRQDALDELSRVVGESSAMFSRSPHPSTRSSIGIHGIHSGSTRRSDSSIRPFRTGIPNNGKSNSPRRHGRSTTRSTSTHVSSTSEPNRLTKPKHAPSGS